MKTVKKLWRRSTKVTYISRKKIALSLKVSKFQNEFMKLLFLPKYEQQIARISALYCTEVHFASFLSRQFITAIVVNPPERKLAKRTSVYRLTLHITITTMLYAHFSRGSNISSLLLQLGMPIPKRVSFLGDSGNWGMAIYHSSGIWESKSYSPGSWGNFGE